MLRSWVKVFFAYANMARKPILFVTSIEVLTFKKKITDFFMVLEP